MATKRRRSMTLAENDALLKAEGQYEAVQELHRQQREAREKTWAEWARAEVPLVEALAQAGFMVRSAWDLREAKSPYPVAIPILLEHLSKPYPDRVREGIARALACPEAHLGWSVIVAEFHREKATTPTSQSFKFALAIALSAAGTDEELDEVIALLRDRDLGANRIPLLDILARSRNPSAMSVLAELQDDKEIADEAKKALKKALRRQRVKPPKGRIH
jgi:hypothetical protein